LHEIGDVGSETIFRLHIDLPLTVPKIIVIGHLLLKVIVENVVTCFVGHGVVSYRLSIVTVALSVTIRPQFAIEGI